MKLLGWMNFKLNKKGNEQVNDAIVAHKEVKRNGDEMNFQEPYDEIFPGFLAIGTLGYNQTSNTDPPTPTFPMSFELGETDITDKELQFINDELEKFLEEKVDADQVDYEPSERISHASVISLSDKHIETGATEYYVNMEEFPLQKYLLGSSVELPELEAEVKKQKGSLQLFKRKNKVQACHVVNDGKEKKRSEKKHSGQFMKKMLQNLQSKSKSTADSAKGNAKSSVSSKSKLPQVLKMFKRKVHPEESMNENKLGQDYELNKEISPRVIDKDALRVNKEQWIKTDADYLVLEL